MPTTKDIQRALARIRVFLPARKQAAMERRNIKLGLERISRVVPDEQKWTGVHVGGTNGKGSICALLAGMFKLSGISHGTYVSPALPERHNAITINGSYVNKRMYEMEMEHVRQAYERVATGWTFASGEGLGHLTPFELETAAAFRVLNKMNVKYGIVEVGMGGATDATNAMRDKAVTVISKIGLDHQEYLGDTMGEIARVKAGIMRTGVPCVVDGTNPPAVLDVLREHAHSIGTDIHLASRALPLVRDVDRQRFPLQDYEQQNLLCARLAFAKLFPHLHIDVNKLLALKPQLPGRMERVRVTGLTEGAREAPILVDGAHNVLGVEALAAYVDGTLREQGEPVSWVMGLSASKSKPFARMVEALVRPQDSLAFVEYTQGPNDPPPVPAELGREIAAQVIRDESRLYGGEAADVARGVQWACRQAGERPVVATGSLYMIRDLYRTQGVEPSRKIKTRRPGNSSGPDDTASPLVPDKIRELQRRAAHHKTQAAGYQEAIRSIAIAYTNNGNNNNTNDNNNNDNNDNDNSNNDNNNNSSNSNNKKKQPAAGADEERTRSVEEYQRRRDEHLRAYNRAMYRIRGRIPDPDRKYISHQEIFGVPEKPARRISALLPREAEEAGDAPPASPSPAAAAEPPPEAGATWSRRARPPARGPAGDDEFSKAIKWQRRQ
ncbi:uncharacterized protein UV8b_07581 [Ustilaginoidea virens]|uniref:Dihydrofolate synthetase Fol3 n=1 Tax=Ustilaginoidea virens TaxID=1159556 RepID=A0A8E5HXS0_USTVR|nr:uncharacterized protein UV8b_07581 [Ustilaginoidea virens]QUC23340.1 hypothetical protein UV8b_07581 [Ustilaginoidea virens]